MGVPKFYRWTSERYPCLSEVINESQIPEFDNLYLDMNGIIHNCSHPNDDDVTFRITEEEIFDNIFAYIDNLYNLIRPQKVFFMAVDGVAPRAKMNQQRARRFMSARTADLQIRKAKEKGEVLPDEKRFDSNCITPGTFFMTRLHKRLSEWIEKKSATDPKWQGREIILSGHNCPGEGEHKIMDFIRAKRASDGYDPNTRHCMYGLDADLIMLGIVSHEPHFSLLREEVTFNTRPRRNEKQKKPVRTDCVEKTFHLLHLSLLREYLAWEFSSVKDSLPFAYDMERVADDWILMGLLVGNDFLPHLPNIHIHDDALPLLYTTYKKVLPTLDGYINEGGYLNLGRFEKFLKQLAMNDKDSFMEKAEDEQFLDSKRIQNQNQNQNQQPNQSKSRRRQKGQKGASEVEEDENRELVPFESSDIEDEEEGQEEDSEDVEDDVDAAFVSDHEEDDEEGEDSGEGLEEMSGCSQLDDLMQQEFSDELAMLAISGMNDKDFANDVEACWTRTLNNSFKRHKKAYYSEKLRYKNISKTELRAQAEGYVRAIQWNLHYYYHGCASWSWFYPHHYAPFISDVSGFADMKIEFELSEPFRPFEQLLAVLPEASSDCLPKPLQKLMTSNPSESPIHDFYPQNFETDLNGKRNDWEAVVLIPFIDEKRLLEAIRVQENQLTADEKTRNSHGGHIRVLSRMGTRRGEEGQWVVDKSTLAKEIFCIPRDQVRWGLLPNVKMDVYFPGFPTMKHLSHAGSLRFANCNIFGMASRKESMVLTVEAPPTDKDIIEWGSLLCDEEVCIDWPILKLAKVESVWGDEKIVRKSASPEEEIIVKDMREDEKAQWAAHVNQLSEHAMTRYAIEIGGLRDRKGKHIRPAIVWVRKFTGLVYETIAGANGQPPVMKAVKQWSSAQNLVPVLLPLVVKDVLLENSRLLSDLPISAAFPMNQVAWVTNPKSPLFGMPGMISGYKNEKQADCRVRIIGMVGPNKVDKLEALRKKLDQKTLRWQTGHECARQIHCDPKLFARITGTIMMWNEPRERVEKGQQLSSDSKLQCGLSLKYSKREICLADYTDRSEYVDRRGVLAKAWLYSNLTCRLVQEYRKKFPEVVRHLERNLDDVYYAEDVWSDEKQRETRYAELREFLDALPSREAEQLPCGTVYADRGIIAEIEKAVEEPVKEPRTMNNFWMAPAQIFRYELYDGKVHADPEADYQILDRVGLMSYHTRVPKTVQGTVVGIHGDKIDVLFDKEFEGGSKVRGSTLAAAYRVPQSALFNITFGLVRKSVEKKKQEQKQLDGAYVPYQQKKPSTSSGWTSGEAAAAKPSESTSSSKSKKWKKEKPEKVVIAKRPNADESAAESAESLTSSLNKLLNIKKTKTPEDVPTTSSATSSEQNAGKSVSLMELLGGGGAAKKETSKVLKGTKTLEEVETRKVQAPVILKASEGQKPNQKHPKNQKTPEVPSILQKLNDAQNQKTKGPKPKLPKEERWTLNKETSSESVQKTSTPESAPKTSDPRPPSPSTIPPFVMPPPAFQQFPMVPSMVIPPMMVPVPQNLAHAHQMHQIHQMHQQRQLHQQQQQNHFDAAKRANPTLTDFKPSTVNNRRPNHYRGNPNAPKVTLITHPKEQKEQEKVQELQDTPIPVASTSSTSQDATSSEPSSTKKPKKKKQSRLAMQFQND